MMAIEKKELYNLLIISYSFPPEWAGPAERFLRYVPGLKKRGVNPIFITRKLNEEQSEYEVYRGAEVYRLAIKDGKWNFERFLLKSSFWVFKNRNKIDGVLALSYGYFNYFPNKMLNLMGMPITALHTMAMQKNEGSAKAKVLNFLQIMGLKAHKYAISSTEELKKNIVSFGFKEEYISVIPNGVDLARFCPENDESKKAEIKKELDLPNTFLALFIGLKTPRKGVLALVKAWKIYKEKYEGRGNLVIVGPERRESAHLVKFYEEWDKETENVEKYGIQLRPSTSQPQSYFKVCDLFMFLSDLEGLPNVLPEAMACGIPILMNEYIGFSKEVAEPGVHVFTTTRTPSQIALDLKKVAEDKEKRTRFSTAAIVWIENTQDVEITLNKFAEILKK